MTLIIYLSIILLIVDQISKILVVKLMDINNGIEIIKIHIQKLKISTFFTLPIGIWVKGREVHSF